MKYLVADNLFQGFHACFTYLLFSSLPSNAWRKAGDCKPLMAPPSSAMHVTFQWFADSPGWIWLDSHLDGRILQAQSLSPAHCRTMLLMLLWPGWHKAPSNLSHPPPNQFPALLQVMSSKCGWKCHYQDMSLLSKCQQSRGIASPPSKSNRATGLGAV